MSKPEEKAEDIDSDEDVPALEKTEGEAKQAEPIEDITLANSDVTTKYQEASKIVQGALAEVSSKCVVGARILDICKAGDDFIEQKAASIFKGKNKAGKVIDRGIAFPVCVSVNEIVCHVSPLLSEDTFAPLAEGDMVKIDLGAQVDGYISVGAHTVVVGHVPNPETPITGARADVITAAWTAAEVAVKLIKPGNTNTAVTAAMKKVAEAYGVRAISGTVMHEMKRYVIDGEKIILLRDEPEQRVEACTFAQYEVYSIDVAMSSGEGKPRETGLRTTVHKRKVDRKYGLKVKASRTFFNEVSKRFPALPFTLRSLSDETAAKMGVRECVNHELLTAYPVLQERTGDQVAHVKFTVLLLSGGTVKVTGLERPAGFVSDKTLPEDIAELLAQEDRKKKKKRSNKKKGTKAAGGAAEAEDDGDDA